MAVKPNVEGMELAKDFARVPPENLVADPKDNSRKVKAADVDAMVRSFEDHGQEAPIKVNLLPDGGLKVVYGYTRHAAAIKYNKKYPDKPMLLEVKVVPEQTAEQAYISSIIENYDRKDPSAVEIAQQCKALLEEYGKDERAVADIFGKPGSDGIEWVRWIQKLLELPKDIQAMVGSKELPAIAAIELVGLEEKDQKAILKSADRMGTGRIKGEDVRRKARNKKRGDGEGDGEGAAAKPHRNLKELVEFFANLTGPGEDEPVRTLAKKILAFKEGLIGLEKAEEWFRTLGGSIKENKDAKAAAKAADEPELEEETPAPKVRKTKAPKKKVAKKKTKAADDEPTLDTADEGEPELVA